MHTPIPHDKARRGFLRNSIVIVPAAALTAVLVGFGWTGAIIGMELTAAGLQVLALERGEMRDTNPDFSCPRITDELSFGIRGKLFQDLAREAVTVRHNLSHAAVPYRQLGSFLPGDAAPGGPERCPAVRHGDPRAGLPPVCTSRGERARMCCV